MKLQSQPNCILGFGSADLFVSLNGGSETRVHHFDTKLQEFEIDLDSIDHLRFEKGAKVFISVYSNTLISNRFKKGLSNIFFK